MEPVTRKGMFLNAVCDGSPCNLEPATREEMFLAAIAGGDPCELEPATRAEVMLKKLAESDGGGGGAEIKTCTVRFVPHSGSDGWTTTDPAKFYGAYGYTKCENGVVSSEYIRTGESGTDFDVVIENVVCGSFMFFDSNAESINLDDANGGTWDSIDTTHFFAPTEANTVCVIKLGVPGEGGW